MCSSAVHLTEHCAVRVGVVRAVRYVEMPTTHLHAHLHVQVYVPETFNQSLKETKASFDAAVRGRDEDG